MQTGALIVAAGMSSRMGDFKPMLNIGSISIAQRIVATLHQAGVEKIVMVTGYNALALERHLSNSGIIFLRNENYSTTHMFDSAKIGLEYLRDKCDRILFSPTEVIAEGFDYANMGQKLLGGSTPDLEGVCSDYYEYYNSHPYGGQYRSATVTLVDCIRLEPLADICRIIFSRHRDALDAITPDDVQGYFTANYHWFYDLYDIAAHAGADDTELAELEAALDGCIEYKAATDNFLTFPINVYSGLSMYLPCNGSGYLDANYRELDWNKATGLVQQES